MTIQDESEFVEIADPTRLEHDRAVARDFRHNAAVGILYEGTWAVGMAFTIVAVLIPAYLGQLAAPRSLIGIASAIGVLTVPTQLLAEHLTGGKHRKRRLWLVISGAAAGYILMGLIGLLLPADGARTLLIFLFLINVTNFFICHHLAGPTYQAIMTDNCPLYRRGRLYGYRAVTLGAVGLLCAIPARAILAHFSPLQSYHAAMLIAGTCFILSSTCPLLFRDHLDPARVREQRDYLGLRRILRESAGMIAGLWNTPNYRVFIYFAMMLAGMASLGTFIITSARDRFGDVTGAQQYFQMVVLGASIFNGLFIGAIADRWGYKITLTLQALIGVAAFVVAQSAGDFFTTVIAFGALSCMTLGMPAVVLNLSVELMPRLSPAHLSAAANVIFLPITVILPWLAGSIIDLARAGGGTEWGYHVVFTAGITLAAVGCLGTLLLVQEPRSGRVYVIKELQRV